jgi:methionine sulfoxide reductase catalytic subunit
MLIRHPSDIAPSDITPPETFRRRREWIKLATAGSLLGLSGALGACARRADEPEPALRRLDGVNRSALSSTEPPTTRKHITSYNNYYEFGTDKQSPARLAGRLEVQPWTVTVDGEVSKPRTFGIEDLRRLPLEERVYRLRCVEAWSMVVPWIGFEFNRIARLVEPTSKAKFVEFVTVAQPQAMPGLRSSVLPWPYTEALRLDEAMHPLTIMAVGLYGEVLPNQNGAPVRLVVPWKYGFKSAKSIVRIRFVEQQPQTTWQTAGPREYGFYSNVNPDVDHPRWSQKKERRIPDLVADRPTLVFNGYGEHVAPLYAGLDLRKFF